MNYIMKDREKHINAVMEIVATYLDENIKESPSQILFMQDIIVECFAMQSLFIRKCYKDEEADNIIKAAIVECIEGFEEKDKMGIEIIRRGEE